MIARWKRRKHVSPLFAKAALPFLSSTDMVSERDTDDQERASGKGIWIFGFGSLIWRPGRKRSDARMSMTFDRLDLRAGEPAQMKYRALIRAVLRF